MRRFAVILALFFGASAMAEPHKPALNTVNAWLLLLNNDLNKDTVAQIAASQHDMVVIDFLPSQPHHAAYPMRDVVSKLKRKPDGQTRLVIAYLNIGQAEDYRTYWRKGWKVGAPGWILMNDPDGWAGNFPVAYWRTGWRDIVAGLARQIAEAGFDGVYLDWVAGFQEETVQKAAAQAGVQPEDEMAALVEAVGAAGRAIDRSFRVIGQNAAPLLANARYLAAIDGVAHESIWFTWGGKALGDCPIPQTQAEARSASFRASLPPKCRAAYDADPGSAMRFAGGEELIPLLKAAQAAGKTVFSVDYAKDKSNRELVARNSRALGFKPFLGAKDLKDIEPPAQ
jgi:cysteinyl-tRNA synthetase